MKKNLLSFNCFQRVHHFCLCFACHLFQQLFQLSTSLNFPLKLHLYTCKTLFSLSTFLVHFLEISIVFLPTIFQFSSVQFFVWLGCRYQWRNPWVHHHYRPSLLSTLICTPACLHASNLKSSINKSSIYHFLRNTYKEGKQFVYLIFNLQLSYVKEKESS